MTTASFTSFTKLVEYVELNTDDGVKTLEVETEDRHENLADAAALITNAVEQIYARELLFRHLKAALSVKFRIIIWKTIVKLIEDERNMGMVRPLTTKIFGQEFFSAIKSFYELLQRKNEEAFINESLIPTFQKWFEKTMFKDEDPFAIQINKLLKTSMETPLKLLQITPNFAEAPKKRLHGDLEDTTLDTLLNPSGDLLEDDTLSTTSSIDTRAPKRQRKLIPGFEIHETLLSIPLQYFKLAYDIDALKGEAEEQEQEETRLKTRFAKESENSNLAIEFSASSVSQQLHNDQGKAEKSIEFSFSAKDIELLDKYAGEGDDDEPFFVFRIKTPFRFHDRVEYKVKIIGGRLASVVPIKDKSTSAEWEGVFINGLVQFTRSETYLRLREKAAFAVHDRHLSSEMSLEFYEGNDSHELWDDTRKQNNAYNTVVLIGRVVGDTEKAVDMPIKCVV